MLKSRDNELITHTDAGTPMGEMFRRYWIPAFNSNEIEADGKPIKIRLLGEDLVAFRDSEGKAGLISERCPHRGTSLYYGINAECGIRCMYHGWKFNTLGECTDLPSEPAESNFYKNIKLSTYPIIEKNGIAWTYMGPKEKEPAFPEFYWMILAQENILSERVWQECNYLQVMENDLDFVHAAFLHKAHVTQRVKEGILSSDLGIDPNHPLVKNPPVKQVVENTNYGKRCIAIGEGNDEEDALMEIHYVFPFYTFPPRFEGEDGMWHAFIPRDNDSTWSWDVQFSHSQPIDSNAQHERRGLDLDEHFRKKKNMGNDYLQDRELMKEGNFSGIRGIANQDHAATETMGTIVDRSTEHLGTSDLPVIQMRQILLKNVRGFQTGDDPMQLDIDSLKHLYSAGKYVTKGLTWKEAFSLDEKFSIKKKAKN